MKQHCGVHGSDPIPGTGVPSLGGVVWTLQRHAPVRACFEVPRDGLEASE